MPLNGSGWAPQTVTRFIKAFDTGSEVVQVETDQGEGFLKVLGNREGPHVLACELVGSIAADWLGLETFDFAIIRVTEDDEIPLASGNNAEAGPAFIAKSKQGFPWGGDAKTLLDVVNPEAISGLVVLDTWVRNCDRYAPNGERINQDNVFLAGLEAPLKGIRLLAIDHTHAFTCGHELTRRVANIDVVRDDRVYGLFPEFRPHLDRGAVQRYAAQLQSLTAAFVDQTIGLVPDEWQVDRRSRAAWSNLLFERARFVADHIENALFVQQRLRLNAVDDEGRE